MTFFHGSMKAYKIDYVIQLCENVKNLIIIQKSKQENKNFSVSENILKLFKVDFVITFN